jgi:hypothetical protein
MARTTEKFVFKMFYLCVRQPIVMAEVVMMVVAVFEIAEKDAL